MKAKEYATQYETKEQIITAMNVEFSALMEKRHITTDKGRQHLLSEFQIKASAISKLTGIPEGFYNGPIAAF